MSSPPGFSTRMKSSSVRSGIRNRGDDILRHYRIEEGILNARFLASITASVFDIGKTERAHTLRARRSIGSEISTPHSLVLRE